MELIKWSVVDMRYIHFKFGVIKQSILVLFVLVLVSFFFSMKISRFKVQGFFICHIINYTGYNQK